MEKYLVIQLARFGDIIQTKRLMLSLLEEAEVYLLVDSKLLELAKIIYPQAKIYGIHIHNTDVNSMLEHNFELFKALKELNFDKVFPLNFSSFAQKINSLFAENVLQGYFRCGTFDRQSHWVKLAFRWMRDRKNTPLNLMDFWAYFASNPISAHRVNPIAKPQGFGLGVVVAGQNLRRSLSPKYYAKIIQVHYEKILQEYGKEQPLFLFGTKNEQKLAKEIISYLPAKYSNIQDLTAKTNILSLSEYVKNLNLLLTPDTGIAHLAAHFGVPVEAYYLASASCFETGPYGLGHKVWQAQCSCSPCNEHQKCIYEKNNNFDELPCHQPFFSQAFLIRLVNDKYIKSSLEKYPLNDLELYQSSFTEEQSDQNYYFGLNWLSSSDLTNNKRENMRKILQNYCIAVKGLDLKQEIVEMDFYQDNDWIFPKILP